jgi:NAD+ synthase
MMIWQGVETLLTEFIESRVKMAGADGVVVGLSGGLDSTVAAYLAERALGKERVLALLLPESGVSAEQDRGDARMVADLLGIRHEEIDISEILECYFRVLEPRPVPRIVSGNLKARIRMTVIYWHANLSNLLVLGTGNKTEIMLGYSTKYGDSAADLMPLAGLYKGDVLGLGAHLSIPKRILAKKPTAGLWPGQTDEEELGISYEEADGILRRIEDGLGYNELTKSYNASKVDLVLERVRRSQHKRELPPRPDV